MDSETVFLLPESHTTSFLYLCYIINKKSAPSIVDKTLRSLRFKITLRTSRTLREASFADFVRDPERFWAASICYIRFLRFGSPLANCVIPLTAFASLPSSISFVVLIVEEALDIVHQTNHIRFQLLFFFL